jgi:hypothetical protein
MASSTTAGIPSVNSLQSVRKKAYRSTTTFDFGKMNDVAKKFKPMLDKFTENQKTNLEIQNKQTMIDQEIANQNTLEF